MEIHNLIQSDPKKFKQEKTRERTFENHGFDWYEETSRSGLLTRKTGYFR